MWISTLHNQFRQLQLTANMLPQGSIEQTQVVFLVLFVFFNLCCCVVSMTSDVWIYLLNRELQAIIKDKSKALKIQNQKILQVYELIPSCLWVLHFQNHRPASPSTYVLSLKSMKTENRFTTLTCKCKPTKQLLTLLNHKNLANSWFYFSDNF